MDAEESKIWVAIITAIPKLIETARKMFQSGKKPPVDKARYELDRLYGRLREIVMLYPFPQSRYASQGQKLLNQARDLHKTVIEVRDQYEELAKDPWYDMGTDITPLLDSFIHNHNKMTTEFPVEAIN